MLRHLLRHVLNIVVFLHSSLKRYINKKNVVICKLNFKFIMSFVHVSSLTLDQNSQKNLIINLLIFFLFFKKQNRTDPTRFLTFHVQQVIIASGNIFAQVRIVNTGNSTPYLGTLICVISIFLNDAIQNCFGS